MEGRIDDINRLLKRRVKVDRTTGVSGVKGYTTLSCATSGGRNEIMKTLLQSGADVDKASSNGITPLYIVSEEGKLEAVKRGEGGGGQGGERWMDSSWDCEILQEGLRSSQVLEGKRCEGISEGKEENTQNCARSLEALG